LIPKGIFVLLALCLGASIYTGGADVKGRVVEAGQIHDLTTITNVSESNSISDTDIKSMRIFAEPLLPSRKSAFGSENLELKSVFHKHSRRSNLDDFSDVEGFLVQHPDSAWCALYG
jgi:hypothetical protein